MNTVFKRRLSAATLAQRANSAPFGFGRENGGVGNIRKQVQKQPNHAGSLMNCNNISAMERSYVVEDDVWRRSRDLERQNSNVEIPPLTSAITGDQVTQALRTKRVVLPSALGNIDEEEQWKFALGADKPNQDEPSMIKGCATWSATVFDNFVTNKAIHQEKEIKESRDNTPVEGIESSRRKRVQQVVIERRKCNGGLRRLQARVQRSLRLLNGQQKQLNEMVSVDYNSSGFLGEGRQGVVRRGVELDTKERCAVKTCNKFRKFWKQEDIGSVRQEVRILKRLDPHPHLLDFKGVYESPINIHIVTELCRGGDLFAFLDRTDFACQTEVASRRVVEQMLQVLSACHEQGVAHLDIKLENIMLRDPSTDLTEADAVLVDFGHARFLPKATTSDTQSSFHTLPTGQLQRPVGSPSYAAPEVVLECLYSDRSDVWSLGVVAYVLLQGYLPFPHLQLKQWKDFRESDYTSFQNDPFGFEEDWQHISSDAQNFVRMALQVNPEMRMSVQDALEHPWITNTLPAEYTPPPEKKVAASNGFLSSFWQRSFND
mmetsp:Transcript_5299/g.8164  ORF Transcript_5299/g.8164 Transcript_5299/m.8164 type:complete len:545 (+) Transcript_5299:365-1999(+)